MRTYICFFIIPFRSVLSQRSACCSRTPLFANRKTDGLAEVLLRVSMSRACYAEHNRSSHSWTFGENLRLKVKDRSMQ